MSTRYSKAERFWAAKKNGIEIISWADVRRLIIIGGPNEKVCKYSFGYSTNVFCLHARFCGRQCGSGK